MPQSASVNFDWKAVGGGLNYDTHGDPVNAPKGFYHGYGKGKNETTQQGVLKAALMANMVGSGVTVLKIQ